MRTRFNKIINCVKEFCFKYNQVEGLLLIGSQNTGKDLSYYSDIDFIIIKLQKFVIDSFLSELENELEKHNEKIVFQITKDNKLIIFLEDNFLKIEFHITEIDKLDDIKKYLVFIREENLEKTILVNKSDQIKELITNINIKISDDDKIKQFNDLIADFLYYFDLASNLLKRGDSYGFYFEYNIALHRIIQMISLLHEEQRIYLPKNVLFLEESFNNENTLQKLAGSMDASEAYFKKNSLYNYFILIYQKISEKYSLNFKIMDLMNFKEKIDERDFIWNFRDIGYYTSIDEKEIRKGKIFRSSKLIFTYPEERIISMIKSKNIRTIIDLRTKEEVEKRPYTNTILKEIHYFNIPFLGKISNLKNNSLLYENLNERQKDYLELSINYKSEIKQIFDLLSDKNNYNFLIHCVAGKDRTGFIILLIELLLDIYKQDILFDYLSSQMDTELDLIHVSIDYIEKQKGIENYLYDLGVTKSQVESIRNILLEKE